MFDVLLDTVRLILPISVVIAVFICAVVLYAVNTTLLALIITEEPALLTEATILAALTVPELPIFVTIISA